MTRRTLGYFNFVIALLMVAMIVLQLVPYVHYGVDENGEDQSVSILGYVVTPYNYRAMDDYMETYIEDFNTGYAMLPGTLIPIFAFVGAIFVSRRRGKMLSSIYATAWSFLSLLIYVTSPFCRLGNPSMFFVHVAVLAVALAISLFCLIMYIKMPKHVDNDREETFESDPRAASKIRNIEKAIEKKDVHELLDFAVSKDKSIRLKAVDGLGKIGGEGAFNLLVPMLRNNDVECRTAAAKALGNLGDARALAFIYDRLEREENDSVRTVLLDSMAQLHGVRAD